MPIDLIEYIKNCQVQGISRAEIEPKLLQTGWTKEQIDQAFQQLATPAEIIQYPPQNPPQTIISQTEPKKNSKKLFLILASVVIFILIVDLFIIVVFPSTVTYIPNLFYK